ncbi:1,5-anhydro-D-fructose reductase [Phlebotomus argentipes]|uniref:1,5-anhydro-D-fructose reductase n=1 Tax=Phlebotomus argentipes TaxID=94469 RepID=UPI002892C30C|nr:1,5-anhydro-D-fructose reductase [Phlebotomus argentipes]
MNIAKTVTKIVKMANIPKIAFSNGLEIPAVGLGTWRAPDNEVETALETALKCGYRHIDAAPVYLNEPVIGRTLKRFMDSGEIKRDELFICTKLPPHANRPGCVEKYLKKSLESLQLDYVDLYLIHTPFTVPEVDGEFLRDDNGYVILDRETDHVATWKRMEDMVSQGLARNIGLSNFNERQIQRILDNSTIKPVNLQIEVHVYLQQKSLVDFCRKNDIVVTAYSPLGSRGIADMLKSAGIIRNIPDLVENPVVMKMASKYEKTPGQILLKYNVQRGLVVIPKSTNESRLRQNIDLFDFTLSEDDMEVLADINENVRVCDFAFFKGMDKHPEFPF